MGIFSQSKSGRVQAQEAQAMVESYYQKRGLNPQDHLLSDDQGIGYWLVEGSAKIYIFIQPASNDSGAILRITSPIIYLP